MRKACRRSDQHRSMRRGQRCSPHGSTRSRAVTEGCRRHRFVGESERPLEQAFNSGLDGRLYTDLSKLGPTNLVTPSEAFYVRTRYPDLLVPESPWRIPVLGLPGAPVELILDDLMPMVVDQGQQLMECSGNTRTANFGLLSSAQWAGIRLLDAIDRFEIPAGATRLLVSGFDRYSQPSA